MLGDGTKVHVGCRYLAFGREHDPVRGLSGTVLVDGLDEDLVQRVGLQVFQDERRVHVHHGVVLVVDQPVEHVVVRHGVREVLRRLPVKYGEVYVHVEDAESARRRRDNAVSLEQATPVIVHEPQAPAAKDTISIRVTAVQHLRGHILYTCILCMCSLLMARVSAR